MRALPRGPNVEAAVTEREPQHQQPLGPECSQSRSVALYARVGRKGDADPDAQIEALQEVADLHGWTVRSVFVDEGTSTGRERLMEEVRAGKVDAVVVTRLDRFARSSTTLLAAAKELRQQGVALISLDEGVDSASPSGRVIISLIDALAEMERGMAEDWPTEES